MDRGNRRQRNERMKQRRMDRLRLKIHRKYLTKPRMIGKACHSNCVVWYKCDCGYCLQTEKRQHIERLAKAEIRHFLNK